MFNTEATNRQATAAAAAILGNGFQLDSTNPIDRMIETTISEIQHLDSKIGDQTIAIKENMAKIFEMVVEKEIMMDDISTFHISTATTDLNEAIVQRKLAHGYLRVLCYSKRDAK